MANTSISGKTIKEWMDSEGAVYRIVKVDPDEKTNVEIEYFVDGDSSDPYSREDIVDSINTWFYENTDYLFDKTINEKFGDENGEVEIFGIKKKASTALYNLDPDIYDDKRGEWMDKLTKEFLEDLDKLKDDDILTFLGHTIIIANYWWEERNAKLEKREE